MCLRLHIKPIIHSDGHLERGSDLAPQSRLKATKGKAERRGSCDERILQRQAREMATREMFSTSYSSNGLFLCAKW
jgi:hypothetical protein